MTHEQKLRAWKKHTKRLGLTPTELAKRLGIATQTIYNWSCGSVSIPQARINELEKMQ
jgi:DNA-binding XRE family transcriptional regulator